MFEHLQKYDNIFVVGPHRSGTTIAAKMIARDTGHDLVLEDDFYYSNLRAMMTFAQAQYGPIVVQCPFLTNVIHDLEWQGGIDMNRSLVVFMQRPIDEIIASEKAARLRNGNPVDFKRIATHQRNAHNLAECDKHPAQIKLNAWPKQQAILPNTLDLAYHSLRSHPLWIEKRDFSVRQTEPGIEPDVEQPKQIPRIVRDVISAAKAR